jgi:ABC-2 type transport system ATP-binding protein
VLALAREVPLVLLDEPLSGIDISSRAKIIRAIVGEYRTGEQTIVLSTHQVQESESIFEEVMFLRSGKIVLSDQAEHLRQQHNCSIQDMWEKVYDR